MASRVRARLGERVGDSNKHEVVLERYDGWTNPDEVSSIGPVTSVPEADDGIGLPVNEPAVIVHMKDGTHAYMAGTVREVAERLGLNMYRMRR